MKQISTRRLARLLATGCFIAACAGVTNLAAQTTGTAGSPVGTVTRPNAVTPVPAVNPGVPPTTLTQAATPGTISTTNPTVTNPALINPTVNTSTTTTTGVTTVQTPGGAMAIPTETTPGATPAPLGTTSCAPAIGEGAGCAPGTGTVTNGINPPPETSYPLTPGNSTPQ